MSSNSVFACGAREARLPRTQLIAQLAQQHEKTERKLQAPFVFQQAAHASELPSNAENEQYASDERNGAPRSQDSSGATRLLRQTRFRDVLAHRRRIVVRR